jgi:hypothetical protein
MQPIDYTSMLTQLDVSPLQRGFAIRDQRQAFEADRERQAATIQLARDKFTADQVQNEAYRTWLGEYNATAPAELGSKLREGMTLFPEQAKALKDGFDTYTAAQAKDVISTGASVVGALAAGNTDLATAKLSERRDGLRNAGVDTTQTDAALAMVKAAGSDPAKRDQAIRFLAMALTPAIGVDGVETLLKSVGLDAATQRAEAKDARDERRLEAMERRTDAQIRATEARIGFSAQANDRAERASARAERKGSVGGGGSRGSSGGDGYEYRIGPDGKLQRRKR